MKYKVGREKAAISKGTIWSVETAYLLELIIMSKFTIHITLKWTNICVIGVLERQESINQNYLRKYWLEIFKTL